MKLYKHQEEALKQTEDLNRVAYYYDMGLGKTYIGSEKAADLDADVTLIICQKSKITDWKEHYMKNYTKAKLYDLTDSKYFEMFFDDLGRRSQQIAFINYELAWRREKLLYLKNFTLMLDESSLIQNRKAKQTKFILKLKPKNVILLSGTPVSGKYENLWTQCRLLGWDITETAFLSKYVNRDLVEMYGRKFYMVNKKQPYKNVDDLKYELACHGAYFKRTDECFDLPEQIYQEINIPVTSDYKKFMKNSVIQIDGVEFVGDTILTKILYGRMLCSAYNKQKINALKDLILSTNDRLIIFYNFNSELDALKKVCEELKRPYSMVNGQIKDLYDYNNHDDSITLCQYQAASKGLNLQKANKIIYFSPTQKVEDYMQSQKRVHRIGQTSTCFYYLLTCSGSVEKQIYRALKRGTDFTNDLFEGDFNEE